MTDEDDDLRALSAAMHRQTPAPDPDRRARNLALAQANFDRMHQAAKPRRTWFGGWTGGLAGGAVAVVALVLVAPQISTPPPVGQPEMRDAASTALPDAAARPMTETMAVEELLEETAPQVMADSATAPAGRSALLPQPADPLALMISGYAQTEGLADGLWTVPWSDQTALQIGSGGQISLRPAGEAPSQRYQDASDAVRFVIAATGFDALMQGQISDWQASEAIAMARTAAGDTPTPQQTAILERMMQLSGQ